MHKIPLTLLLVDSIAKCGNSNAISVYRLHIVCATHAQLVKSSNRIHTMHPMFGNVFNGFCAYFHIPHPLIYWTCKWSFYRLKFVWNGLCQMNTNSLCAIFKIIFFSTEKEHCQRMADCNCNHGLVWFIWHGNYASNYAISITNIWNPCICIGN